MAIDWQIEVFDSLPSTMDIARERAEAGASEGLVIVTKDQTAGKGRGGNIWIGKPGNLYMSLILKPVDVKNAGQYSFIAANALADVVMPRLKSEFFYRHKWPNDGLINVRKFAGILPHLGKANDGKDFLNMGVGVNIVDAPEGKIALNDALVTPMIAEEFRDLYLASLERQVEAYKAGGFNGVRTKWLENAKGLSEPMTARLPNETLVGIFNGIDEDGGLLLGLDIGGQKVIRSGEVYFGNEN